MICASCRLIRQPADLLMFWPVGEPDRLRYVCRPTAAPSGKVQGSPCFAMVVGPATEHAIALVERRPALTLVADAIRPYTDAWTILLASAGVRPMTSAA